MGEEKKGREYQGNMKDERAYSHEWSFFHIGAGKGDKPTKKGGRAVSQTHTWKNNPVFLCEFDHPKEFEKSAAHEYDKGNPEQRSGNNLIHSWYLFERQSFFSVRVFIVRKRASSLTLK